MVGEVVGVAKGGGLSTALLTRHLMVEETVAARGIGIRDKRDRKVRRFGWTLRKNQAASGKAVLSGDRTTLEKASEDRT